MNMTSSHAVRLLDLVMLFLKEKYPYWKFRCGEWNDNVILDDRGYTYGVVGEDEIRLMWTPHNTSGTIKAADPAFFEKLATHVLEVKGAYPSALFPPTP